MSPPHIFNAGGNTSAQPLLRLSGISKHYPTVIANEGIDFRIIPGEIHAVLGENGAGKSTLMKIIYGVIQPTSGMITWQGQTVTLKDPAHARTLGIGMVFQHFSLFETLSVTENISLSIRHHQVSGDDDSAGGAGRAGSMARLARRIEVAAERYGLPVDPYRPVHSLSIGERQRVEIIRCLLQKPKLLIMDEPTSVLTPQAVQTLFATLRTLAAEGCAILYISHKLDEIRTLCDSATILRGGKVTGHCQPQKETTQSLAKMMIGQDIVAQMRETKKETEEKLVRLSVKNLSYPSSNPFGTSLDGISFEVKSGEIFGIAGISGNGQQELLRILSGEDLLPEKNPIEILGVKAGRLSVSERRTLGLGFIPEERLGRGAVPGMSLAENQLLTSARRLGLVRGGVVLRAATARHTEACIDRFNVKCGGVNAAAKSLSGGNLQKFIVGRELLQTPKLLIVAQPSWGVDVGAAVLIHEALIHMRDQGGAVLVISEELDELFTICDRIAVIAGGRLSPARRLAETSVEEIGIWMSGLWPSNQTDNRPDTSPTTTKAPDIAGTSASGVPVSSPGLGGHA